MSDEQQVPENDAGVGFDPRLLIAGKEVVYTPNTVGITEKDPNNGTRKMGVAITPTETLVIVLQPQHQEYLLENLAGGIEIADLADIAKLRDEEAV